MNLMLKNTNGESVTLVIGPDDTFLDLRERVQDELGLCLDLSDIVKGQQYIESQRVLDFLTDLTFEEEGGTPDIDIECVVPGCSSKKSTHPDKTFFEFPTEDIRNHQWALYCQRLLTSSGKKRFNVTPNSRICSDHFRPDQFVKNTSILKMAAVPCLNPEIGTGPLEVVLGKNECLREVDPRGPLCRLCAQNSNNYVFIFDETGERLHLADKIQSCLPIKIDPDDHLPKQVCLDCVEELEVSYNFSIASEAAHLKLQDKFCNYRDSYSLVSEISKEAGGSETPVPCCPLCVEGKMQPNACEEPIPEETEVASADKMESFLTIVKSETLSEEGIEVDPNGTESEEKINYCQFCLINVPSSRLFAHSLLHVDEENYMCCVCVRVFSNKTDLENHIGEHDSPVQVRDVIYQCKVCAKDFKSFSLLSKHSCSRDRWLYKCNLCDKSFKTESRLRFHKKFHDEGSMKLTYFNGDIEVHCCEECGRVFRSAKTLKYHQRCHDGESIQKPPYSCEVCGKCFVRRSVLRNHVATNHKSSISQVTSFSCHHCNESFPSTHTAIAHIERIHVDSKALNSFDMLEAEKVYVCEYCRRCFTDVLHINLHRSRHRNDLPYECKYCNLVFSSFEELDTHQGDHTADNVTKEYSFEFTVPLLYICEFCDRNFMSYVKYTEHLTVHYGSEPYTCCFCENKFATIEESCYHRAIHLDKDIGNSNQKNMFRPYECHYCNKAFGIEDALVKHIRMHTGEKPFICDICGKGFSQSSGLYTHLKVHSSIRPFSCSLCPQKFKLKGDRDVHVRKHSGERPYKCEFCSKAFMTQHVYSQHRKIHTGERPYKCDVCGIAFRRSHVLTVHKRIHTGEKPNICDICGKCYRQKGDLFKHRKKHKLENIME